MSIGADAADQMIREGIQITEAAVKLAALGAKNLAALLFALASSPKSRGATTARKLVKNGQTPTVTPIPKKYMKKFKREARRYSILYAHVKGQDKNTACIVTPANQTALMNQVRENIGCPAGLEMEQPTPRLHLRDLFARGAGAGKLLVNPAVERLEGIGAENLAALVLAMATGDKKDRAGLKQLAALLTNKEGVQVYPLPRESAAAVREEAATFEIPCFGVQDKDGPCTLIVRTEDVKKLETIMRNRNVTPVRGPEPTPKNNSPRVPSERESDVRGIGVIERRDNRPSIKPKMSAAKSKAAAMRAATQRMRPAPSVQK